MKPLNQLTNLQLVAVIPDQEIHEAETQPSPEITEALTVNLEIVFQSQVGAAQDQVGLGGLAEVALEDLAAIAQEDLEEVALEDLAAIAQEDLVGVDLEDLAAVTLEDLAAIVLETLAAIKKPDLRQKHAGKKLNRSDSSLEI